MPVRLGLEVVPRDELDDAALEVAGEIAAKDTRVIRAAKEALNGIDPIDVNKSYRFEQGFTYRAQPRRRQRRAPRRVRGNGQGSKK